MLQHYRKQDAVFIVCQNYDKQVLEMAGANDKARQLAGIADEALIGKPLQQFIAGELLERIDEDLDFQDRNYDLGDLLAKTRTIHLRMADGNIREMRLRVVRSEAIEGNPVFHLVMEDEKVEAENEQFRKILSQNFKGNEQLEEHTNLPDRGSLLKDIELIQHYQKKKFFGACLAVIQVDKIELIEKYYESDACYELLGELAKLCRQRLRTEDLVGIVSGRALGLILMHISPDSARIVLNRLRWSIGSMPIIMDDGTRLDITVSIAFQMCGQDDAEHMLRECENGLQEAENKGGSILSDVGQQK